MNIKKSNMIDYKRKPKAAVNLFQVVFEAVILSMLLGGVFYVLILIENGGM
jgi:hypothetical protein